jgi:hypothetical protein
MSLIRKLSSAMSLDRSGASSPRVHPTDGGAADAAAEAAEAGAAAPGSSGSSDAAVTVVVQGHQQQQEQAASASHSVALVATAGDSAAAAAQDGSVDAEPPITAINKKAGLHISFADTAGSRAAGNAEEPGSGSTGAAAAAAARKPMPPRTSLLGEWLRQPLLAACPPSEPAPASGKLQCVLHVFPTASLCNVLVQPCMPTGPAMTARTVWLAQTARAQVCARACMAVSAGVQLPSCLPLLLLVPPKHYDAACRLPPCFP